MRALSTLDCGGLGSVLRPLRLLRLRVPTSGRSVSALACRVSVVHRTGSCVCCPRLQDTTHHHTLLPCITRLGIIARRSSSVPADT